MKAIHAVRLFIRGRAVCVLGVFVLLLTASVAGAATTYYVAPTGSDSGSGSASAPFKTIQKAADTVNAGDTVIVDDGVYTDTDGNDVVVYVRRGGTSSAWVTFKSKNKQGAKIDGANFRTKHGWHLDAAYVIVQDFDIYGMCGTVGAQGADGVDVETNNVKIVGNAIHDIGRYCTDEPYGLDGILIGAKDSVTISQNRVYNIGRLAPGENGCNPSTSYYQNVDHGIYVDGSSNVTILNNLLYNNKRGWSIHVYPDPVSNLTISNNTFVFPNPYRPGQVVLAATINGGTISNNVFYQPTTSGIRYSQGTLSNVTIQKNITYGGTVLYNETSSSAGLSVSGNMDNKDPMLANPAGLDFHITASSPAIDAGVANASVSTDFDGKNRPQGGGYDIGAFEFSSTTNASSQPAPAAPTNVRVVRQ